MAHQDELTRDIHKEIRQEKWLEFWQTHRTWLIISLVSVLALVVTSGFWLYLERTTKEEASSLLLRTLYLVDKTKNTENAASAVVWQEIETTLFDSRQKKWPIQTLNYTVSLVHHYLSDNQPQKALTVLEQVPPVAIPYFDQLLILLKGQSYVMAKDTAKAKEMLKSLADNRILSQEQSTSVFGYIALEWLSELAWQTGDKNLAITHLKNLSDDPLTPPAIRKRATQMLRILS